MSDVYEIGGRTTREYLRSIGVPETRDQAWIVDSTKTLRALRKERGEPPAGCLDLPTTSEEESEVARRLQALGITKPADPEASALWACEIADLPAPGWCGKYTNAQMERLLLARRAQGPSEGPGLGTALAVGLGAVGLLGFVAYMMSRKPSKFALAEYTIGLNGSAFDPRAQKLRDALEREGFEVTGFGTASRFDGGTIGGDIDVLDPRGTSFDQAAAVEASRRLFKLGQKHGVDVSFVSAGPSGEEKKEMSVDDFISRADDDRQSVLHDDWLIDFADWSKENEPSASRSYQAWQNRLTKWWSLEKDKPVSCIPCGEDSGWEVVKSNGEVSYPYHNKGDAEADAKFNGGKVRPIAKFSESKKLKKVYGS